MGLRVTQTALGPVTEGSYVGGVANRLGQQVVMDFYTAAALQGRGFQIRAGTVTSPLVGSVTIAATGAEMCADAPTGTVIIPVGLGVSVRLGTGTLHEYAAKSVATASSAGTAFIPLPMLSSGGASVAAVSTARVAASAGAVTVTTELATTTLRHWEFANPVAAGAGFDPGGSANASAEWNPKVPPILVGPRCFYIQIAATGTGPSYYAHFDYLEFPSAYIL